MGLAVAQDVKQVGGSSVLDTARFWTNGCVWVCLYEVSSILMCSWHLHPQHVNVCEHVV